MSRLRYEYKCVVCEETEEVESRDTVPTHHDRKMRRVWSVGGITFKGSGFHKNDYKGK